MAWRAGDGVLAVNEYVLEYVRSTTTDDDDDEAESQSGQKIIITAKSHDHDEPTGGWHHTVVHITVSKRSFQ